MKSIQSIFGFVLFIGFSFLMPSIVTADSYDGPFCWEKPIQRVDPSDEDDKGHLRGTCKFINYETVISLDETTKNDYLLGTHNSIKVGCERGGCAFVSTTSEVIRLTNGISLTLDTKFIDQDYSHKQYYDDTIVLLNRPFFTDYFSKLEIPLTTYNTSVLAVLKKDEMITADKISYGEDYNEIVRANLEKVFTHGDPAIGTYAPITGTSTGVFTYDYKALGSHIASIEGAGYGPHHLTESSYISLDTQVLPQQIGESAYEGHQGFLGYTLPITNPLMGVKDYWVITNVNGKVTMKWVKSEYALDNGMVQTVTNAMLPVKEGEVATSSPSSASLATSSDGLQGFFYKLWTLFLSLFR